MPDDSKCSPGDFDCSLYFIESADGARRREARIAARVAEGACPVCLQLKSEWRARPDDGPGELLGPETPADVWMEAFIDGLCAPRYLGDCKSCGAPLWGEVQ